MTDRPAPAPLVAALLAHPVLAAPAYPAPPPGPVADPAGLLAAWLLDALAAGEPDAQVVTLSTLGADGHPDARVLVLRDLEPGTAACHFWTEPDSAKARQFAAHPQAALTAYWPRYGRQVRLRGPVRPGPGCWTPSPALRCYVLHPVAADLWQAAPDRRHLSLHAERTPDGWTPADWTAAPVG
ncbi:pyridoxamine 5'-phosphate oxidase family protein [Kitasatospora sp. NPDC088134]|uniref:pyridoxamine 5'-phosphate oxidase family protein n=1 Tax=Kitasatospora sp. NPDC088134 TaxID=3364071 RepID=UPI00380A18B5